MKGEKNQLLCDTYLLNICQICAILLLCPLGSNCGHFNILNEESKVGEFSLKIIVVGCGKIGTSIISALSSEGHDVVAIDQSAEALSAVTDIYDVMGVCGNGADLETLEEASANRAELFVAVSGSDELNMLSCYLAGKLGAQNTVARIRNPQYNERGLGFMREQLGLAMAINPELLAAHELFNILKLPSAIKIESFSRRNFEMIELAVKEDSVLNGMRLSDIRGRFKAKFLVCAVTRGDKTYIPDGNFHLAAGDKVGLAAAHLEIQKMLREMNLLMREAKNIMILGGSRTAYYLARMLTAVGNSVKIIEKKESVCNELAEALPKAVVIHGDGASQELLLEEGIHDVDAFVSLTGMDEENILMSIFASTHGVPKVIAKINSDELTSISEKVGVDCIISPKLIIADVLVRYARALQNSEGSNVEHLYKLMDGKAEALEFNVSRDSPVTGIPLKELNLKPGILIAGILRDRHPIIPDGDDMIFPGDGVVVMSSHRFLSDLSEILDGSPRRTNSQRKRTDAE